jgi:tetratricopeptide (TPR) repeat protein
MTKKLLFTCKRKFK